MAAMAVCGLYKSSSPKPKLGIQHTALRYSEIERATSRVTKHTMLSVAPNFVTLLVSGYNLFKELIGLICDTFISKGTVIVKQEFSPNMIVLMISEIFPLFLNSR